MIHCERCNHFIKSTVYGDHADVCEDSSAVYPCHVCSKRYGTSSSDLVRHVEHHHPTNIRVEYQTSEEFEHMIANSGLPQGARDVINASQIEHSHFSSK